MRDEFTSTELGQIANFEMGQSPSSTTVNQEERGLPFLQGSADFGPMHPTPPAYCSAPGKVSRAGDILISVRAPVGALNKSDRAYAIGRGLAAVRFYSLSPRYGWHVLSYWAKDLRRVAQGSTFEAIGRTELSRLRVLCAPTNQQNHIADILDTADAAIQQTESLIAKLRQMRAGLLSDLLTHGLDEHGQLRNPLADDARFKTSPLGLIPSIWQLAPLASVADKITSGSRGWAAFYADEGPLFLRIGNLTREHINLRLEDVVHVHPPLGNEGTRTAVQEGDVLISITADLGNIGVIPAEFGEAYVNQHIALVRIDPMKAYSRWIGTYLTGMAAQRQFFMLNDSGAKAGLNLPTVGRIMVALPPLEEQRAIVNIIDAHDARIRTEEECRDKLKLLKQGLMDDVLTGRVRAPIAEEAAV